MKQQEDDLRKRMDQVTEFETVRLPLLYLMVMVRTSLSTHFYWGERTKVSVLVMKTWLKSVFVPGFFPCVFT